MEWVSRRESKRDTNQDLVIRFWRICSAGRSIMTLRFKSEGPGAFGKNGNMVKAPLRKRLLLEVLKVVLPVNVLM